MQADSCPVVQLEQQPSTGAYPVQHFLAVLYVAGYDQLGGQASGSHNAEHDIRNCTPMEKLDDAKQAQVLHHTARQEGRLTFRNSRWQ